MSLLKLICICISAGWCAVGILLAIRGYWWSILYFANSYFTMKGLWRMK